jgi:hypothetical protein
MKYVVIGIVVLIVFLIVVFRVKKSTMTASTPPPPAPPPPAESNIAPVYSVISAAGEMQSRLDEITKKHILNIQTLTDPTAITNENTTYAEQVKKIRADYEAKVT